MSTLAQMLLLLLVAVIAALVIEILALRRKDRTTISETSWWLQLNQPWVITMVFGLFMYLMGHLTWQSTRTYDALRCEQGGGQMLCVYPVGKAPSPAPLAGPPFPVVK